MRNINLITLENVSLAYELYYDKTSTLKESIVNLLERRKYVSCKKDYFYALRNISITIDHGERIGIIGLNGSGKSTMLKMIAGLLKPTEGSIKVNGKVQPLIEVGAGFNPEFSGRENIYLNGAMLGFTKEQIRSKETEIIDFAELGDFIDVPVKYYSSGMSVRLAFTIATIIRPEILVLDEMLSAGDLEFIQKAKSRIEEVISSAKILVLVSHDLGIIRSLTTRVIVLNKGYVVYDGLPDEAIEYYMNIVSDNIERKEDECALQQINNKADNKTSDADSDEVDIYIDSRICIKSHHLQSLSTSGDDIYPENDVRFTIEFQTSCIFDQFYINLVIKNKTNTDILHLRNDFSEIELLNFESGDYRVEIPIYKLPFRSNVYKYFIRLVGICGAVQVIKDTELKAFHVLGSLKRDKLIHHDWVIDKL